MKRIILSVLILSVLSICSCNREYKTTKNGAKMKFYTINKDATMPEIGDLVIVDVIQKIADTVVFNSRDLEEPFEIIVEEPSFTGDIMCALLSMHLNDHASVVFPIDSIFSVEGEQLPDFINEGTITEMNIVLKEIVKKEEMEKELREELNLRKNEELLELKPYYDNADFTVTEDSLVVVAIDKGNGKFAEAGNIMRVHFIFHTLEGDTLFNFTTGKPYELVYGDMALGQGFYEALSLVDEKGEAEFVIPSSLAFGSEGFYDAILPYTSFKLNLKVVDIMTSEEYETELQLLEEEKERIKAQRLKNEPYEIAKYLKVNNIDISPKPSGLYYIEKESGNGESVQYGDLVYVHYVIYNLNDELIESSYEYGQPLPFVVGENQMITGIEEAVSYMKVGGMCKIIVPSQLGFGDIDIDEKLPANSAVIIDLELVDLQR